MKKIFVIGIFSSILLIMIFGLLWVYSYNQLQANLNDIELDSIELDKLSESNLLNLSMRILSGNWFDAVFDLIQGINLNLKFELINNGLLPVNIPNLTYDLLINDIPIGSGNTKANILVNPGQTIEITTFQNIQKNSLNSIIESLIDSQGVIDFRIKGIAYFELLGFTIPIPLESSKQISIVDEIQKIIYDEIS